MGKEVKGRTLLSNLCIITFVQPSRSPQSSYFPNAMSRLEINAGREIWPPQPRVYTCIVKHRPGERLRPSFFSDKAHVQYAYQDRATTEIRAEAAELKSPTMGSVIRYILRPRTLQLRPRSQVDRLVRHRRSNLRLLLLTHISLDQVDSRFEPLPCHPVGLGQSRLEH